MGPPQLCGRILSMRATYKPARKSTQGSQAPTLAKADLVSGGRFARGLQDQMAHSAHISSITLLTLLDSPSEGLTQHACLQIKLTRAGMGKPQLIS